MGISKKDVNAVHEFLVSIVEKGLPLAYSRSEADGYWDIEITKDGEMILGGYAEESINFSDWKKLPISELALLIESSQQVGFS